MDSTVIEKLSRQLDRIHSPLVYGLYKLPLVNSSVIKLFRSVDLAKGTIPEEFDFGYITRENPQIGYSQISDWVRSCAQRVLEFFRRLTVALETLGCIRRLSYEQAGLMCAYWMCLYISGRAEKVWKYQLCAIFARSQRQELPSREEWMKCPVGTLGPGFLYRWSHRRMHLKEAWEVLMLKKMFPPVDEFFIKRAILKHRTTFEKSHILEDAAEEVEDLLAAQVQRTVREVVGHRHGRRSMNFKVPSCSAHFEQSRSRGGATAYLSSRYQPRRPQLSTWELISAQEVKGTITWFYLPLPEIDPFLEMVEEMEISNKVRPSAVAEPCKARIVTAGPIRDYYLLRQIQKDFHSALRDHPVFQLIGTPCTAAIVESRIGVNLNEDEAFNSGDYEAATDNLNPWLSEVAATSLLQSLGYEVNFIPIVMRALTGHELHYVKRGLDPKPVQQEWGQLMGSVISFPILCLVNAAVCRWALELAYGREWSMEEVPLLVNGDDCLMRMPIAGYEIWKDLVTAAGLTPSLGKNYLSRNFASVNSELYVLDRRVNWFAETRSSFRFVPYVNMGLLLGFQSKGMKDEDCGSTGGRWASITIEDLSARAWSLVRGFDDDDDRDRLMSIFVREHRSLLADCPKGQSWWVPKELGGLGLPPTRRSHVTDHERKLAAYMTSLNEPEALRAALGATRSGAKLKSGLLDVTVGLIDELKGEARWVMDGKEGVEDSEEEGQDPFSVLVPYAYFLWDPSLDELDESKVDSGRSTFRAFERLRKRALASSLAPMSEEAIWSWQAKKIKVTLPFKVPSLSHRLPRP